MPAVPTTKRRGSRRTSVVVQGRRGGVQVRQGGGVTVISPHPTAQRIEIDSHPETGACYFIVMPHQAPVMAEHRDGWRLNERPWLRFIDTRTFNMIFPQFRDRRSLFCCWLMWEAPWLPKPADRRASVVSLYAEALDDDIKKLLPQHRQWLATFMKHCREFDGVLGHTPWMAEKLSALTGLRSAVLPSGFDARVLGSPRWDVPKIAQTAWYGTMVGKRERLIRHVRAKMGSEFLDVTGNMSRSLVDKLQLAKTVLYLGHSNCRSYSTWRTWHAISSSAAIITEPGDYWPLDPETCIEIPSVDEYNVDEVIRQIRELSPTEALAIARRAHERLRGFTVENMIDKYLVPNTEAWLK